MCKKYCIQSFVLLINLLIRLCQFCLHFYANITIDATYPYFSICISVTLTFSLLLIYVLLSPISMDFFSLLSISCFSYTIVIRLHIRLSSTANELSYYMFVDIRFKISNICINMLHDSVFCYGNCCFNSSISVAEFLVKI